jgi:ATP-dependent Clp protease ATP-binding subunit ClpA
VDLQLRRVEKLAAEVGVRLEVTDAARDFLAREGYDPVFGARPLKRAIQRQIQDPLALHLLDEEVAEGSIVRADVADGGEKLELHTVPAGELAGSPAHATSAAR